MMLKGKRKKIKKKENLIFLLHKKRTHAHEMKEKRKEISILEPSILGTTLRG